MITILVLSLTVNLFLEMNRQGWVDRYYKLTDEYELLLDRLPKHDAKGRFMKKDGPVPVNFGNPDL